MTDQAQNAGTGTDAVSLSYARPAVAALLVLLLAASLCLVGTATRPIGYLAGFWPANAVTAAIFLRYPSLSTPLNWAAAVAGFLLVDLGSGNDIVTALSLTAANFAGILSASFMLKYMGQQVTGLTGGMSILAIFFASVLGAGATSIVGSFASAAFFGVTYTDAFMFWISNELINHATLIPLVLAIPTNAGQRFTAGVTTMFSRPWLEADYHRLMALALLVLLCGLSLFFNGQIAYVFPLPAMILVAMLFPVFATTAVVLLYTVWCQAVFFLEQINQGVSATSAQDIMTIRFAITLLALGPMAVACMNAARDRLRQALDHAAQRDDLTGVLNRRAFLEQASAWFDTKRQAGVTTVVLMLDIDHFKSINDRYGHAGGDDALRTFTKVVTSNLRNTDLLGRLGGEEFAILARTDRLKDAEALANRIREAVKQHPVRLAGGSTFTMTVSIGCVARYGRFELEIEEALHQADTALYQAKHAGRDQVVVAAA